MTLSGFSNPYFLITGFTAIPLIWLYIRRLKNGFPTVPYPSLSAVKRVAMFSLRAALRHVPFASRIIGLLLLAVVLGRLQSVSSGQVVSTEGIDIILAIDISASMRARDFTPDRAGAAIAVASDFIRQRPDDRIGLVLFAKQAFTQCPLTVDHSILQELLAGVKVGLADPDNTAIGQALGTALNRLKGSESKSKVVILLTDGENNYGQPPTTLAEAAQSLGVRIYTIGVGSRGTAPFPVVDPFGRTTYTQVQVSIDEDLLKSVASTTGGQYFRATDDDKLSVIFKQIDKLEKTRIEVRAFRRYAELYDKWALAALIIITVGWMLSSIYLRVLT